MESLLEHFHRIADLDLFFLVFGVHISFVQKLLTALVILHNFHGCHKNE